MIPILLSRELSTLFAGDVISEGGLLALELSRLVVGSHPVEDVLLAVGLWHNQYYARSGRHAG